jgi:zinc transport system substrate-binding protein
VRVVLSTLLLALVAVASGCGGSEGGGRASVVASFYPLAWAAERIAGPSREVVNLTPAGAEPHDLELSPRHVETIHDAELVVYVGGGFQPAVEDAVDSRDGPSLDLLREGEDPHIWLDPVRFAGVVRLVADELGDFASSAATLRDLRRLHALYRRGLADCERRVLVTTHASFGALAARYGLTQLSIAGRSPEAEPGPRDLERIVEDVRASGATTVFTEPLVSSRLAETVAREAGVGVATLDPIEGLSEERLADGEDYLSVMRGNLETLREALGCR